MRFIAAIAVILLLPLLTGATVARPRQFHEPDAAFFLATNDDVSEAIQSYAEVLCLQDKMTEHTPAALLAAGAQCQDSKRNSDGDSQSSDGDWREYSMLALIRITVVCAAEEQMNNLCRWFR